MNESISTAAGSAHGQFQSPAALRRAIRAAGRTPAERDTRYGLLRTFPARLPEGGEAPDPLDLVDDPAASFGSYSQLTHDPRHRFRLAR
jgi:hypothetical protein